MKKLLFFLLILVSGLLFQSCKKQSDEISDNPNSMRIVNSPEILQKIKALGYSPANVYNYDSGYLVEGDIFLHGRDLNKTPNWGTIRVANTEQYRTNNLVTGLPRTINVYIQGLPQVFVDALDIAVQRYNALGLQLTFVRRTGVSFGFGHISIGPTGSPLPPGVYAASGPPTGSGNPYPLVPVQVSTFGLNPDANFVATILAHEIGHCIGFRHTDFMDRSFSCGGSFFDEGAGPDGAVHIPGTPTTAEAASWMLACTPLGVNRPFTANDIIALNFLY